MRWEGGDLLQLSICCRASRDKKHVIFLWGLLPENQMCCCHFTHTKLNLTASCPATGEFKHLKPKDFFLHFNKCQLFSLLSVGVLCVKCVGALQTTEEEKCDV